MKYETTEMLNMLFGRLRAVDLRITKETKILNHSFNDLVYIHENSDPRTLLFSIETMIDDVRWPQLWVEDDHLNFYDLIPEAVEKRYVTHFEKIRKMIHGGNAYHHLEKIKSACSQSNAINALIDARDAIFNSIKEQKDSKTIDLRHLGHLAYVGLGSLAYMKTINDSDYKNIKESDDLFQVAYANGMFNSKKPIHAIFLYSGSGYLENAWAEKLGIRSKLFIDNTGLDFHYLFSENAADHSQELITLDTFYKTIKANFKNDYTNLLVKNNAIQNSNFDDVIAEMELLRLLSKDFKIFYTLPVVGNNNGFYSKSENPQMNYFTKELLLTDPKYFKRISELNRKLFGERIDVGLEVKKDMWLSNQYRNDNIFLQEGTKILRFQSWEYNYIAMNLMREFGGLNVAGNSSMKCLFN